jgi:hypothetical protein
MLSTSILGSMRVDEEETTMLGEEVKWYEQQECR